MDNEYLIYTELCENAGMDKVEMIINEIKKDTCVIGACAITTAPPDIDFTEVRKDYYEKLNCGFKTPVGSILKFPLNVLSKQVRSYGPDKTDKCFERGYAELNVQRNGAISFLVRVGNEKCDYKIALDKWSLLQMVLYHLSLKPIIPTTSTWSPAAGIRRVSDIIDFDVTNPLQLIMSAMSVEQKEHLEAQVQNLLALIKQG